MASRHLHNYLRTYRKKSAFSQREVAYLLGTRSDTKISRHECFARVPSLRTVFIYEVIYRVPARDLFVGVFERAHHETLKRVECLRQHLQNRPSDPVTTHKIKSLTSILTQSRASAHKAP
ncbi:MAG: hypothetical protein PHX83_16130 [Acidobacteriia bacterium]|nr:hypothetical protein [Terriglobia bacterium]